MKVLIIDDEPDVRMLLRDILEEFRWDSDEAQDCLEGLNLLKTKRDFDIALVDWKTPKMSGLEMVKAARTDPSLKNIPLVMITGLNDLESIKEALSAGANEYIMKPFTKETISDKLKIIGIETGLNEDPL